MLVISARLHLESWDEPQAVVNAVDIQVSMLIFGSYHAYANKRPNNYMYIVNASMAIQSRCCEKDHRVVGHTSKLLVIQVVIIRVEMNTLFSYPNTVEPL